MNATGRIPIPWKHRWRRFRFGMLPGLGLFVFAVAAFWLWGHQGGLPHSIGEIESRQVEVAAAVDGILAPSSRQWVLLEEVRANDLLLQLDDRLIQARLTSLNEELIRLRKELDAATARLSVSEADRARLYGAETIRLDVEMEQRRLTVLDRQVQTEVGRLETQRTNMRVESLKPLYDKKMVSELEMNEARMLRDEAAKRLAQNLEVLKEAQSQQKDAEGRVRQLPALHKAEIEKELAPMVAAAKVQEARIAELNLEIQRLTIRSPIDGAICAIHHWPGETVKAADPIVAVAPKQGRYIVSYVRQEQRIEPHVGMKVDVRVRAPISRPYRAPVECVGPQIEPIPVHLCRDPKMPEWGRPVRITLPADLLECPPGQLLEVTFKPES